MLVSPAQNKGSCGILHCGLLFIQGSERNRILCRIPQRLKNFVFAVRSVQLEDVIGELFRRRDTLHGYIRKLS